MSSPKEITDLIKNRRLVKASLTRLESFINNYNATQDILAVKLRLPRLPDIWNKFEEIQDKLEILESDPATHDDERSEFETKFYAVNVAMQKAIDDHDSNLSKSNPINAVSEPSESYHTNVRLPALKLPNFSGQYDQWIGFCDMFNAMVHENETLSDIQRFHYLKSTLSGEAEHLIRNLPMTSSNYSIAWGLLRERYDNKRLIATSHIHQLLQLNTVHDESAVDLAELINTVSNNMNALEALNIETPMGEIIVSQIVTERLDPATRKAWELKLNDDPFPRFKDLLSFLEKRRQALKNLQPCSVNNDIKPSSKPNSVEYNHNACIVVNKNNCLYCQGQHPLRRCIDFLNSTVQERKTFVFRNSLCLNCLLKGHRTNECKNNGRCKHCQKTHHSLLHSGNGGHQLNSRNDQRLKARESQASTISPRNPALNKGNYCSAKQNHASQILLATAIVMVKDIEGRESPCRALLDGGSQASYITEFLAQRLKLRRTRNEMPIAGINHTTTSSTQSVNVNIISRDGKYNNHITCFILPSLTGHMPSSNIDVSDWNLPSHIHLADDQFNVPSRIDMLIGSDLYPYLMKRGRLTKSERHPVLQETHLGWILLGRIPNNKSDNSTTLFLSTQSTLDAQLRRFWEQEEIVSTPRTKEEEACEKMFVETTTRDESGRFIVKLPRHVEHPPLGDSFSNAERRFLQLERRLAKNQKLRDDYTHFMNEYCSLGHMQLIPPKEVSVNDTLAEPPYYLPHHAVFKESSTTTKTRVVFDASAKTSSGTSLNDTLMVGPTIQEDLLSIVLRFRTHIHVMIADISKMYRMVRISPEDYDLQRIVWRKSPDEPLSHFQLVTVTYGTSPASFLATRCLVQLAEEEAAISSHAAKVIRRDMYVDDLLTGADDVTEAQQLQEDIIRILQKGGFSLHKWCSNNPSLLRNIPEQQQETQLPCRFEDYDGIKTLGLLWHPSRDTLQFEINVKSHSGLITKRKALAIIASVYDPLGLVAPVIISYKIFMQQLWLCQITWDEIFPEQLQHKWQILYQQLPLLNKISIPRFVKIAGNITNIQVHGFSDASENAFAACVYLRCENNRGEITSHLLCSKSRVAPVKQISIPRLELCGAQLLANLIKKVIPALCLSINSIYLWTDSMIVLSWLNASPTKWKTYVANRVSDIQGSTSNCRWQHVPSEHNPADLLSRGTTPTELEQCSQWWHGPTWLAEGESHWPTQPTTDSKNITDEERRQTVNLAVTVQRTEDISARFSSLTRLQRVLGFCLRFSHNAKTPQLRKTGALTVDELQLALHHCIRQAQASNFASELHDLENNSNVARTSRLSSLHPFLDGTGLIRVGGRLQQSTLDYDHKHPVILPAKSHLTDLIVRHEHVKLMHGGSQLINSSLRSRFWILNAKQIIRKLVRSCVRCYRFKAAASRQLMGQLPSSRVSPARPFYNCGVDYAGPLTIRLGGKRSKGKVKCYIALFICLATKAIHIEVVSDMTSEAFLAALRRLFSRRGNVCNMYSDNGSNFKGANNKLNALYKLLQDETFQQNLHDFSSIKGLSWHFIPPDSPHFGGLWEAGVKSMKHHLYRVVGNQCLTFEELCTVSTQIEACLNSRPLCPLPSDPNDPQVLTPGHFLIGGPLSALPDPNHIDVPINRLSRWQMVQQFTQQIWKRWSMDYLNQLQQRYKWATETQNLKPGSVVLLKDDHSHPLQWKLGIVDATHMGLDGLVRVVDVRTPTSVSRRAVHKLCLLPIDE